MKKAFCSLALSVLLVVCFVTPPVVQGSQQKVAVNSSVVITPTFDPANSDIGSKQSSLNLTATVDEMTSLIIQKTSSVQVEKAKAIAEEITNQENILAGAVIQGTLVTQVTADMTENSGVYQVNEGNTMVQKNNSVINADVGSVNLLTSTSKNTVGTEAATSITTTAKVKSNQSLNFSSFT